MALFLGRIAIDLFPWRRALQFPDVLSPLGCPSFGYIPQISINLKNDFSMLEISGFVLTGIPLAVKTATFFFSGIRLRVESVRVDLKTTKRVLVEGDAMSLPLESSSS